MDILDTTDHIAAIGTAGLASWAWAYYHWERFWRRVRLERRLRDTLTIQYGNGEEGAQSIPRLMAALGMSEKDIMDASFRSRRVERTSLADPETGHARTVLLRYDSPEPPMYASRARKARR